ncbi:hypothetical protein KM908_20340 [Alkalihalobacillus clausii]|jgi:hypothetical protein|uniref:hypothetical protein n=1 Tax=Shouchella clausii TaxID=79880 RepID=UPI001C2311ED|nr:hypothetical protein [Shouchella clausii]MBU8598464.1 hypothetical protein [Shouchella clausii]
MWIVVREWHDNDVCVDNFVNPEEAQQFYDEVLEHTAATVYLAKVEEFAEGEE